MSRKGQSLRRLSRRAARITPLSGVTIGQPFADGSRAPRTGRTAETVIVVQASRTMPPRNGCQSNQVRQVRARILRLKPVGREEPPLAGVTGWSEMLSLVAIGRPSGHAWPRAGGGRWIQPEASRWRRVNQ